MVLEEGMRVLDVGAGKKGMKEEIDRLGINVKYASLDTDTNIEHDFRDLKEVARKGLTSRAFLVIEHLELEDGAQLLADLREKLTTGDCSYDVLNIYNPGRFFMDASHKTFYSYERYRDLSKWRASR